MCMMRIIDTFRGVRKTPVANGSDHGDGHDDVERDIKLNMLRIWIVPPDHSLKQRWDTMLLLLALYGAVELPLLWAFQVEVSIGQLVRRRHPRRRHPRRRILAAAALAAALAAAALAAILAAALAAARRAEVGLPRRAPPAA